MINKSRKYLSYKSTTDDRDIALLEEYFDTYDWEFDSMVLSPFDPSKVNIDQAHSSTSVFSTEGSRVQRLTISGGTHNNMWVTQGTKKPNKSPLSPYLKISSDDGTPKTFFNNLKSDAGSMLKFDGFVSVVDSEINGAGGDTFWSVNITNDDSYYSNMKFEKTTIRKYRLHNVYTDDHSQIMPNKSVKCHMEFVDCKLQNCEILFNPNTALLPIFEHCNISNCIIYLTGDLREGDVTGSKGTDIITGEVVNPFKNCIFTNCTFGIFKPTINNNVLSIVDFHSHTFKFKEKAPFTEHRVGEILEIVTKYINQSYDDGLVSKMGVMQLSMVSEMLGMDKKATDDIKIIIKRAKAVAKYYDVMKSSVIVSIALKSMGKSEIYKQIPPAMGISSEHILLGNIMGVKPNE